MSRNYSGLPLTKQNSKKTMSANDENENQTGEEDSPSAAGSRPNSREMLDNLAEELNQLCHRMRRTSSVQSGISHRPEENYSGGASAGGGWASVDIDHPSNRTPTHQSLNSRPQSRGTRGYNPELTPVVKRDRLSLNLLNHECAPDDEDDPFDQQFQYFIKTPVSPSKAVQAMGLEEKNVSDHQLYFEPKGAMEDSQEVYPSLRRLSTHVKPEDISFISSRKADDSSGFSSSSTSENLHPSHRAVHRFAPRHSDEILLEVGDPVHVEYEADDSWCHGTNLRTGQIGIFPMAHVFEVDIEDDYGGPLNPLCAEFHLGRNERATFILTFMGSVEVAHHKGNDVLVQAISKVLQFYQNKEEIVVPQSVLLDISFRGIHMIDKSKKNWFRCPNFDYFYSLQNISFCGAHPKQLKYFGFITKHPLLPRFACHVFMSKCSTEPVVEAIGRAFQKSYNEYMAFSHPTEDIYME